MIASVEKLVKYFTMTGLASFFISPLTNAQNCPGTTPIWEDEFSGSSVDQTRWEMITGDGCAEGICGWGNNELQYYRAENATVSNGTLKITAKKESFNSSEYTSARMRTANMPNGGQWTPSALLSSAYHRPLILRGHSRPVERRDVRGGGGNLPVIQKSTV